MTNCPICNQTEIFRTIKESQNYKILKCNKCDSIFTDPPPFAHSDPENSSIMYPATEVEINVTNFTSLLLNRYVSKVIARFDLEYLRSNINLSSIKTAFEVGSKYGFMIQYLSELRVDATGIEPIKYPLLVTNKIFHGYFHEKYLNDKKYNLIILGDVLYFIPNGVGIIKKCISMLENGGYLFITCYNPESVLIRHIIERHKVEHNFFISKKGYEKICAGNNCELINFSCYNPKLFVIDINFINKIKAGFALLKYFLKINNGFEKVDNGIRTLILIRKN